MLQRDDDQRKKLIDQAIVALESDKDAELRASYAAALFDRGALEDLDDYAPEDLAAIAADSYDFTETRKAATHKLRVVNPESETDGSTLNDVTVIECVNDNMPFLLDSALAELTERGIDMRLVLHPIDAVERDKKGKRKSIFPRGHKEKGKAFANESLIHIHVPRIDSDLRRKELQAALDRVFEDVRRCVRDWREMRDTLLGAAATYRDQPPPIAEEELIEAVAFLEWLADDNFILLGMRKYAFVGGAEDGRLERIENTNGAGLGLLRDPDVKVLRRGREFVTYTPELREFLMQPVPLIVTKANVKSTVHRRAHLDYIGVKTFDTTGKLVGELRIVGLFTAGAYNRSVKSIPLLRRKAALAMEKAGHDPESHSGRMLLNVLEQFPRDELIQIDQDYLTEWAQEIMLLNERPRIRVLARADRFDRFVSALVFVPRDRYNTANRVAIGDYLAHEFRGRVSAFYPSYPEGSLARVHFIIGRYEGETPEPSRDKLETDVAALIRTWDDGLEDALDDAFGALKGSEMFARYRRAFPAAYQETYSGDQTLEDIRRIETLDEFRRIAIDVYRPIWDKDRESRFALKVFHLGRSIPLSERVPILENMGFRVINERSYSLNRSGPDEEPERISIHDMTIERRDQAAADLDALGDRLKAGFMAVVSGTAENDGFNALIVQAGLGWRDVSALRAYSRYLRQVGSPYSQDYIWDALNRHGRIAALLISAFYARFDPSVASEARATAESMATDQIRDALEDVPSLDDDRIIRRFLNAIQVTLRTNFFQTDVHGQPRGAIAFKLRSRHVDELPQPRPYAEISVYSPRVEGVHLRFGQIARGGLRWSDRPQDFRTEVLGLVKAQQVKNAVIVPVGAKGGFVPKWLKPGWSREQVQEEGVAAYKIFISSLLDVTDNLDESGVIPPDNVVRHDGDDPYLVVAADKGTATFSDIANGISEARGHWLGDAFASGGSAGYDHKKMGITARGGWEAVKRHFREMDIDIQTTPFTAAGCGDMSGDVFGNGMLLSKATRLIAAFDHRDIFVDPNPDPKKTEQQWEERKRLFDMGRSSWQDYNRKLISKGGGVFSRREKKIKLTREIKAAFELDQDTVTPNELIRAILKAQIDLMWFGGIGTYIRATDETDDQVGDRANDALRITADELRYRVIGEGANLGLTQLARIEFARHGGRVNSDAIDNSAGVNSSDVEVNIKIALGSVVRSGVLTLLDRNTLLAEMTDEVAGLVLRNNYLQTLSLSLAERRGTDDTGFAIRFMRDLEQRGALDRGVEDLPSDDDILERQAHGFGLTRPELAVLLAYAKIELYQDLLDSTIPDDAYFEREVGRYFPQVLNERYPEALQTHRLRREIISTMLSNSMINRGGPTFMTRIGEETGAGVPEIATAFALARDSYRMTELNGALDALDTKIPGMVQLSLHAEVQDLLVRSVAWFLSNRRPDLALSDEIGHYRDAFHLLGPKLGDLLCNEAREAMQAKRQSLLDQGVPEMLAAIMAGLPSAARFPDIVKVADQTGADLVDVADCFFTVQERFHLMGFLEAAKRISVSDTYDRIALNRAVGNLAAAERGITTDLLATGKTGDAAMGLWEDRLGGGAVRVDKTLHDMVESGLSLAKLTVGAAMLQDLVGA
ncbi:MAG: NAD-glutamate dehydrogenase [Pseudomonadota bacterium]